MRDELIFVLAIVSVCFTACYVFTQMAGCETYRYKLEAESGSRINGPFASGHVVHEKPDTSNVNKQKCKQQKGE